ncbi:hypothetical protein, conserved [Eimeria acervulina]|uniref:Uncharacterized protein n=1 Tax=Eimeria acervulina TaxID=5801 RepID=U6GT89_EIMAC|nr:hypothetical protein, conserved [Eimeria acervulina]CDI83390.1 hypothetical protein, conserved [Eimeria acervulina]
MPKQTASASGAPPHEAPEGDTAAAAEAAAEHSDAAAAAAEPAAAGKQQQQGKSRKVRFQKNDPNTFTFKLLPVSQQQLREQAAAAAAHQRPRMQLQRVIPPNARNKPQQPLPEYLQQQLEKLDIGEEETGTFV